MVLYVPEIANVAKAGQFINVYTGKAEMILPRPISISEIDKKEGTLRLLYQVIGHIYPDCHHLLLLIYLPLFSEILLQVLVLTLHQ